MAVVFVTGCSSGFGEAIATGFLERGDQVVASMRDPEQAPPSLREASKRFGSGFEIVRLDITKPEQRSEAISQALERFGRLDVLVNNAGVASSGSLEDTSLDLLRRVFETNFFGTHEMMRLALPVMRRQGGGRIINITAIGAIFSTPLYDAYCASKHALDSITATADIDARPFGVRVISVLPGQFKTAIAGKRLVSGTSEPYQGLFDQMARAREKRASDVLQDLTPVVATVIEAATVADPKPRYAVGKGMAEMLAPVIAELEKLHRFDLDRAGVA